MSRLFCVLDTETSGLVRPPAELLEVAAVITNETHVLGMFTTFVQPKEPIPAAISGINGITWSMVALAPPPEIAYARLAAFLRAFGSPTLACHNFAFDKQFIVSPDAEPGEIEGLCTRRLAQHLLPNAENHRNQTLRYELMLEERGHLDTLGIPAHRALPDALTTAALLRHLVALPEVAGMSESELVAFANRPILIQKWWLGKYFGHPIVGCAACAICAASDKPFPPGPDRSYIAWALKSLDNLDADKRFSLEEALRA